jgi:hypothetical protein
MAVAPALAGLAPWVLWPSTMRGALRAGVSVDAAGFTEWYPLGFRLRHRWDRVRDVVLRDGEAIVLVGNRWVPLAPPLAGWREIAARAQHALAPEEAAPEPGALVHPSEVMLWLGARRELVCAAPARWWRPLALAVLVGLAALPFAALEVRTGELSLVLALLNAAALAVLSATGGLAFINGPADRRVSRVHATGDGIDAQSDAGWRRYGWGALAALRREGLCWVVETTDGDLWLPPDLRGRPELLAALETALAARDRGQILPPAEAEVPATALSRASGEASDERGLSRVSP